LDFLDLRIDDRYAARFGLHCPRKSAPNMPLSGLTILEVDDCEAHNYALSRMLQKAGARVLRAATGNQALLQAAEQPDAIVLDISLPDIDGFEVCRRLNENPATRNIPVIFLTATYQDSIVKDQAEQVGAKAVLFFPVEDSQLATVLLGHIKKAKSR
jgi:CheY-like chemotaxis protein